MSVNFAILGLLNRKPMTGYDLKKIIQDSDFLYWSGNNNQVYKALTELLESGFVTNEIFYQESSPSKKVYTVTEAGVAALKEWVLSSWEHNEVKKPFLVQFAWSYLLNREESVRMLDAYEMQIKMQIELQKRSDAREDFGLTDAKPAENGLETVIWKSIAENVVKSCECELDWIQKVRTEICRLPIQQPVTEPEPRDKELDSVPPVEALQNNARGKGEDMVFEVRETNSLRYVYYSKNSRKLSDEKDFASIMTACLDNGTNLILFDGDALSERFYDLKTGLAGALIQKFTLYKLKAAIVIPDDLKVKDRFREMISEINKGSTFRSFSVSEEAERWFKTFG